MSINKKTKYGSININDDAIARLAGQAISECYGIVGLTSKSYKDRFNDLLKKENFSKGVIVSRKGGDLIIDIFVIVSYGLKISEALNEAQKTVKYIVEKTLNMDIKSVNIHVEGIKVV